MEIWEESKWRGCVQAHEERVESWVAPHLERRSIGLTHPVDDFLFTYYSYRPAALRRWHPGIGVALTGPSIGEFLSRLFACESHRRSLGLGAGLPRRCVVATEAFGAL